MRLELHPRVADTVAEVDRLYLLLARRLDAGSPRDVLLARVRDLRADVLVAAADWEDPA